MKKSDDLEKLFAKVKPKSKKSAVVGDEDIKADGDLLKKKSIAWNKVGKTNPQTNPSIWAWINKDFVIHIKNQHFLRFGVHMDSGGMAYQYSAIKSLRSMLDIAAGTEVDKPTVKGYIDFFFKNYADDVLKKYGVFVTRNLLHPVAIKHYSDIFKIKKDPIIQAEIPKEDDTPPSEFSLDSMNSFYDVGGTKSVLLSYGIILTINYLITVKKADRIAAVDIVSKKCIEACEASRETANQIIEITERMGPYPKWLQLDCCKPIVNAVKEYLKDKRPVKIKMVENVEKFEFLR